jgi:hypothetical protein
MVAPRGWLHRIATTLLQNLTHTTLGAHPNFKILDKGRAISFARTARRCADGKPLIDRSRSKITSNRRTASAAIGETIGDFFELALTAISARTKNFLLACAQLASG